MAEMKTTSHAFASKSFLSRPWPIFPGTDVPSIFGAGGLNYCVRDGNRCDPTARRTEDPILSEPAGAGNRGARRPL